MIHLQPTPDQEEAAEAVASFLQAEMPIERLRPRGRELPLIRHRDQAKWAEMGALGFFGLGLEEDLGGVGLGVVEETLAFREFGRYLVAPRVLGSVLGARVAARAGRADLVEGILAGTVPVGLLLTLEDEPGTAYLVDGADAEWALTWNAGGAGLVDTAKLSDIEARESIDSTLEFAHVRLPASEPEIWVTADVDPIPRRGDLLCAAMLVGLSEGTRDDSVEFAKMRKQFNQPIGSFQAVKHRCADMATRAAAAWAQILFAVLAEKERTEDVVFQVTAAKLIATDTAIRNAQANIQNHGATGFTSEVEAHHFLKRSHLLDQVGTNQRRLRDRLLEQPAPPA